MGWGGVGVPVERKGVRRGVCRAQRARGVVGTTQAPCCHSEAPNTAGACLAPQSGSRVPQQLFLKPQACVSSSRRAGRGGQSQVVPVGWAGLCFHLCSTKAPPFTLWGRPKHAPAVWVWRLRVTVRGVPAAVERAAVSRGCRSY